jgi:hypothetical protein
MSVQFDARVMQPMHRRRYVLVIVKGDRKQTVLLRDDGRANEVGIVV